jgi:predicted DNA-binding transcriptional regulator YafY
MFKKRKNALFQIVTELHNTAILQNKTLTADEFEQAFNNAPCELLDIDFFYKNFMKEAYGRIGFGMFAKTKNGYRPVNKNLIPIIFSRDEAEWLKTMLNDDKIDLFLDNATKQKLNEVFAHNVPLYEGKEIIIHKNITRQDFADVNFQSVFKTILCGIVGKKIVRFEYIGRKNNASITTITAIPLKIYYQVVNDSFQCIVFDAEKKNKPTINIERIVSAVITDDSAPNLDKPPIDKIETVEVELRNEKNIPTQCFMLLSDYQKKVIFDDTRNLYKITILYYEFERQDLFKNLLSLGSHCTVLSPEIFVKQIKQRLENLSRL